MRSRPGGSPCTSNSTPPRRTRSSPSGRTTPGRTVSCSGLAEASFERNMADETPTTTLYRPVGQAELDLIRAAKMRRFPPRLAWQPIFYPVLDEEYAVRIAR